MVRLMIVLALMLMLSAAAPGERLGVLPTKNVLPLTPANFCAGAANVLKATKQDIKPEVDALCGPNGQPTATFTAIMARPYAGTGDRRVTEIRVGDAPNNQDDVQIMVAFAMRFTKGAVPVLLKEEPYIPQGAYEENAGDEDGLKVSAKFLAPPLNLGDSDTAFAVEQLTTHAGNGVDFTDKSQHDLKLYRMHQNNFDFLLAARTLAKPTEQFKRSVALRGVMTDPADPTRALSFTVINLIMNGRDNNDNVIDKFMDFIMSDMATLYAFANRP